MKKHAADILIVDDEEHFRTVLSSIMEEEGFKASVPHLKKSGAKPKDQPAKKAGFFILVRFSRDIKFFSGIPVFVV